MLSAADLFPRFFLLSAGRRQAKQRPRLRGGRLAATIFFDGFDALPDQRRVRGRQRIPADADVILKDYAAVSCQFGAPIVQRHLVPADPSSAPGRIWHEPLGSS
jgi:hypothetical protein